MVHGANSVDGILPDNCNCSNYVQCVRDQETDEFTGYFRSCNPCEIWDQEVLTCVLDQSQPNCVFQPSTQATGPCPLGVVEGNEFQFMLGNDTIMDCAPGTKFNYSVCTCVHYDPGELCYLCIHTDQRPLLPIGFTHHLGVYCCRVLVNDRQAPARKNALTKFVY